MPIYAYRCESCSFAQDVLQKMSDAPLTQCPECGKDTFRKQVTAAGFQLKGSGWYATDFRGSANQTPTKSGSASETASADNSGAKATGANQPAAAPASAPASSAGADSNKSV